MQILKVQRNINVLLDREAVVHILSLEEDAFKKAKSIKYWTFQPSAWEIMNSHLLTQFPSLEVVR